MDTDGFKNMRAVMGLKKQNVANFWASNNNIVLSMDADCREATSLFKVDTSRYTRKLFNLLVQK